MNLAYMFYRTIQKSLIVDFNGTNLKKIYKGI